MALKAAREASKGGSASKEERKKDDKRKDQRKKDNLGKKEPDQRSERTREWWGGKNHWASKEEALQCEVFRKENKKHTSETATIAGDADDPGTKHSNASRSTRCKEPRYQKPLGRLQGPRKGRENGTKK